MEEEKLDNKARDASDKTLFGKEARESEAKRSREELFYEFGFSTFILSLSTSALVNLGELPDPITSKKEVNLQLAKQTISIIEMLQEKTKGNLTNDEEQLMSNVLFDVRLKYVRATSEVR